MAKGVTFRLVSHAVRNIELVEIWHNGTLLGAIYPAPEGREDAAIIRIISKHLQNLPGKLYIDAQEPPALVVDFEPLAEVKYDA